MLRLKTKLPASAGVYIFAKGKKVLYIGKATNLRDRVRSYFSNDLIETRGRAIVKMVADSTSLRFQETKLVLEAVILEAKLIKKYQPLYNTKEKSDKSFNYLVVTKEDYPRVLIMRGKDVSINSSRIDKYFGPFPQSQELKIALSIIRKIFPFRDSCQTGQSKPCFNAQIGLCPGVCSGLMSKKDYAERIRLIKLFFSGKGRDVSTKLKKLMNKASDLKDFEKAAKYRNQIRALDHMNDIALIRRNSGNKIDSFRIEAYDIAHISGTNTVGVMTVMLGGEIAKSEYKKFKLKGFSSKKSDDTGNLKEVLERRLSHPEWGAPDLIVVDGSLAQKNVAEKTIAKIGTRIPVVGVVKDEHHKPKEIIGDSKIIKDYRNDILLVNSEAHRFAISYHKSLRDRIRE